MTWDLVPVPESEPELALGHHGALSFIIQAVSGTPGGNVGALAACGGHHVGW